LQPLSADNGFEAQLLATNICVHPSAGAFMLLTTQGRQQAKLKSALRERLSPQQTLRKIKKGQNSSARPIRHHRTWDDRKTAQWNAESRWAFLQP